jgi:hypothetical protein
VGGVDHRQPGVDDLLVERLLLLEAEDLAGLLGEHSYDAVEHDVVEVGVVHGDRLHRQLQGPAHGQSGAQPGERLGGPVDGHHDRSRQGVPALPVPDHDGILMSPANHPVHAGSDLGLLDLTEATGPHQHQIVVGLLDVLDQDLPVLPVHGLGGELDPLLQAALLSGLQVGVRDQAQPGGDQAVVDLALALQLHLVLVLLGEGVLHLLEAVVVESGRVDMAAHDLRPGGLGQPDRHIGGGSRVIGVV